MSYTITDTASDRVQAVFLKAHCRVLSITGMKPPRGLTKRMILDKASRITGVSYKRGEFGKAADDLQKFVNTCIGGKS